MQTRGIFDNISALDHRYSVSEKEIFDNLSIYLSENAAVKYSLRCEAALIKAHLDMGAGKALEDERIDSCVQEVSAEEVYAEEEKTRHHIRALVNVLKKKVPAEYAHLVHLGATSADILDTANALRIKDCVREVVLPLLKKLEKALCEKAEKYAAVPQIGRTHGQHAVPVTFGFAVAEYVSRLGKTIVKIEKRSNELCGKLSGPVGAYNALCLIYGASGSDTSDYAPEIIEKKYLDYLGLQAGDYSNQLTEPEYMLRLLLEMNIAFGIIANLADDLRNLQRTEIGEVFEHFGDDQVGSSAMPQKRNPWNSEHVKSLWKAFSPRVLTFFSDQISEHQRDLTNSASSRFVADYIAGFCFAAARMLHVVDGLKPDAQAMLKNLRGEGNSGIMAEAAYILLAKAGVSDAHEIVRRITLKAESQKIAFTEALKAEKDVCKQLAGVCDFSLFENPERYCGLAEKKARSLAHDFSAHTVRETQAGEI